MADDKHALSLVERDLRVLWHPATHFRDLDRLPPLPIASAQGVWLTTTDGRQILDAISSWWTCLHGHAHPEMVAAVRTQVERLDHVMLAGFTHESAVTLAEELLRLAPGDHGKVFYADCGSAAVEVALKMSFQARQQRTQPARKRFATLTNGYHGETLGALGVGGSDAYRSVFAPLLFEPLHLPAPALPHHAHVDLSSDAGADTPEADAAISLLEAHADQLTALVIEPLVQCAGRMTMTGAGFYRRIAHAAQRLGIHVIADEIAVAFGRTGRLFASTWAGVEPDLLCLSKGLSGGVLPLACVLVRRGFEDDFKGEPSRSFLHSHTFTGNPIACAAGVASLQLLTEGGTLGALPARIAALGERLTRVAQACPAVLETRQAGMIGALRVAPPPGTPMPEGGRLGLALREAALARGVLLRPLHDTVYWMPPLVIDDEALDKLADVTIETIMAVLG
jgi:adenosylmethionine---8-amino-7-oxononanoate aminotransferase